MSYATPTQVFALDTGRTYTATSKPNTTQVEQYLDTTAAELDGILRKRGYTVPVATTATSAHTLLAGFNAYGAIAIVEQSAPTSGGKATGWQTMWEAAKKMLDCGDIELDAPRNESTSSPRGFRSRGEMGFPASPMIPLTFET